MPYYQIKDKYIFLYGVNYNKLNDIALKDKDSIWAFRSKIEGRKENIEAEKIRHKTINRLFNESSYEDFYKDWIYFDLQEHKVILDNLPYLFYDYGCINKLFSYKEIHADTMQTFFSNLHHDKDCSYEIALLSTKGLFRRQEKVFSTTIDTRDIISVKGELNDFTIDMKNKSLHFGKSIIVIDK